MFKQLIHFCSDNSVQLKYKALSHRKIGEGYEN